MAGRSWRPTCTARRTAEVPYLSRTASTTSSSSPPLDEVKGQRQLRRVVVEPGHRQTDERAALLLVRTAGIIRGKTLTSRRR